MMIYLKSVHFIGLVWWFGGLFYLPRLFVYHTMQNTELMYQRFLLLERRLYYVVMLPAAIVAVLSGLCLAKVKFAHTTYPWHYPPYFMIKMAAVLVLLIFHAYLGYVINCFARKSNKRSEIFFRYLNEVPTLLLILITAMAVIAPKFT